MYNKKKNILRGLIISFVTTSLFTNSFANDMINKDYSFKNNSLNKTKYNNINNKINPGTVKEITLSDGQFVPNLDNNPEEYETIRVITTGNKELVQQDYDNLKKSKIPKIDLSNSKSYEIPNNAFDSNIDLVEFKFPKGINYIGDLAFNGCRNLKGELKIPNTVITIGNSAFNGCSSLTGNLVIPNGVVSIGSSAFLDCTSIRGSLSLPNSLTIIGGSAFFNCIGLTGDIVIPNSVTSIGNNAFFRVEYINKFVIKVDSRDSNNNYKKSIIDNLPDTTKTVIDLPYDFNISGTWLENTKKTIGKPIIKNVIGEEEFEFNGGIADSISLHIPASYQEKDVIVYKDSQTYLLPQKNNQGKYLFKESGVYEVEITTTLGNVSNLNFQVEYVDYSHIEEAINQANTSKDVNDIETARELINNLPESIRKDGFQNRLDSIFPNIQVDRKNVTSSFDLYIKSANTLSLTLNTNSITFDEFSGIDDLEKLNAINFTVNSSLPYSIEANLPQEIIGINNKKTMDKRIINIKNSKEKDYKVFSNINQSLILSDTEPAGENNQHYLDLKLKGGIPFEKDIYKAAIKIEIKQK